MTDIERENLQSAVAIPIANQITDLLKGTVEIVTEYRCSYHPRRAATSVCDICATDLCSECSYIRNHRLVCRKCMSGLDKAFGGAGAAPLIARALTHPFTVVLVIAGLLGIILFQMGSSYRLGLLGKIPANVGEAEKQFQLRVLLFTRKANRIETHADALHEAARYDRASEAYRRAKAVCESLIEETDGRWEQAVLIMARARLLEKLGDEAYAMGLYENVATLPDHGKMYPVLARFRLARLQEKNEPEKALKTYKKVISDIRYIPANVRARLNITAGMDLPYDYETRMYYFTGNVVDFDGLEAEANKRMDLVRERVFPEKGSSTASAHAGSGFPEPLPRESAEEIIDEPLEESEEIVITHF
jgi:tetratricopeptide (TPR) repeat protein